jgi:dihydrofolate synthase/folylpolyglutamate synthase
LDFKEAEEFLNSTDKYGIKPSLDRIKLLCDKLGNPQLRFPSIHITGTNGKTSTARMISSVLVTMGKKTARYTSPHLQSVTERISIDERPISERDFARFMEKIKPWIEETNLETGDPLSYFEISTALAFKYFADRRVDIAVVEVGMGGRWDATNLVDSRVSVITNIAYDHVAELGPTLEDIAREKVGIIKPGNVVISAVREPGLQEIVEQACRDNRCPMKLLGKDFETLYHVTYGLNTGKVGQIIGVRGLFREYADIYLPLLGEYQAVNAACAIAALEALVGHPRGLSPGDVERGLGKISSPGRLEVVSYDPVVLLDGAHNLEGAHKLAQVLRNDLDYDRLILVLGILEDKDYRGILQALVPLAHVVVLTRSQNARAASIDLLKGEVRRMRKECLTADTVPKALKLARTQAGVTDLVCVTGSLYTVGEARDALRLPVS